MEPKGFSYVAGGSEPGTITLQNSWARLTEAEQMQDLLKEILGLSPIEMKAYVHQQRHIGLSVVVLFIVTKPKDNPNVH